jgi:hypothetical protein
MRLGDQIDAITEAFNIIGISVSQFLNEILSNNIYSNNETVVTLQTNGHRIMELLARNSQTIQESVSNIMSDVYMQEILNLSAKKHGSHFAVSHTSVEQLEEFNMDLLGRGMQRLAPKLWGLLDRLLFAGKKYVGVAVSTKGPEDSDEEDTYWEAFGDRELDGLMGVSADTASAKQERITAHHNKLVMIVSSIKCA